LQYIKNHLLFGLLIFKVSHRNRHCSCCISEVDPLRGNPISAKIFKRSMLSSPLEKREEMFSGLQWEELWGCAEASYAQIQQYGGVPVLNAGAGRKRTYSSYFSFHFNSCKMLQTQIRITVSGTPLLPTSLLLGWGHVTSSGHWAWSRIWLSSHCAFVWCP